MKSLILVVLMLGTLSAHAYREVVGGGGGTFDPNGRYTTFFSANMPVKIEALRAKDVPAMYYLIQRITLLEISGAHKSLMLKQIVPSSGRNYFKIDEDKLSPEIKEKILAQYSELMKVPVEKVVIYGITDPETKDTFLMPAFFELTETQQAAVLFHESLWILNPSFKYDQVVAAEQSIQAFFEYPASNDYFYSFYYQLGKLVGDPRLPILPIFKRESLGGFAWSKRSGLTDEIYLVDLLGEAFLRCSDAASSGGLGEEEKCSNALLTELVLKSQLYPDSNSIRYLIDYLIGNGTVFLRMSFSGRNFRTNAFYNQARIFLSDFDNEFSDNNPVYVGIEKSGSFGFSKKTVCPARLRCNF